MKNLTIQHLLISLFSILVPTFYAFDIKPGNKRIESLAFTKQDGSPGVVEGSPVWESSAPDVISVVPSADGLSADIINAGGVGSAIVTARADGDLGAGVFPIVITEEYNALPPLGAVAGVASVSEEVPV